MRQLISPRKKISFNDNWQFQKDSTNPATPKPKKPEWLPVQIPHDLSIEGKIKKEIKADETSCVHIEINALVEQGNFVSNADHLIKFYLKGPAKNIGVENRYLLDLSATKGNFSMVSAT